MGGPPLGGRRDTACSPSRGRPCRLRPPYPLEWGARLSAAGVTQLAARRGAGLVGSAPHTPQRLSLRADAAGGRAGAVGPVSVDDGEAAVFAEGTARDAHAGRR